MPKNMKPNFVWSAFLQKAKCFGFLSMLSVIPLLKEFKGLSMGAVSHFAREVLSHLISVAFCSISDHSQSSGVNRI